jgi:predicted esterase YcpF (UPF0227 family)
MTTIVYIHGYNSSCESETGTIVLDRCRQAGYNVIGFNYDSTPLKPFPIISDLINLDKQITNDEEEIIYVGSSLGGFFANVIACMSGNKAVLINPAIRAYETMKKYNVDDCVIDELKTISGYITDFDCPQRIVICGNQDDIVDPDTNGRTLPAEKIELDMPHRFDSKYIDILMQAIIRLDNNIIQ